MAADARFLFHPDLDLLQHFYRDVLAIGDIRLEEINGRRGLVVPYAGGDLYVRQSRKHLKPTFDPIELRTKEGVTLDAMSAGITAEGQGQVVGTGTTDTGMPYLDLVDPAGAQWRVYQHMS